MAGIIVQEFCRNVYLF